MQITELSLRELTAALEQKEISSREATEAYLASIAEQEPQVGAYLSVTEEAALSAAVAIDERRAGGEKLPLLAGVPCGIKDNICTGGVPTTCATSFLPMMRR